MSYHKMTRNNPVWNNLQSGGGWRPCSVLRLSRTAGSDPRPSKPFSWMLSAITWSLIAKKMSGINIYALEQTIQSFITSITYLSVCWSTSRQTSKSQFSSSSTNRKKTILRNLCPLPSHLLIQIWGWCVTLSVITALLCAGRGLERDCSAQSGFHLPAAPHRSSLEYLTPNFPTK